MKLFRVLPLIALVACGDTTSTATTQLNLDRPIDIAFACYGGLRLTGGNAATADQDIITTAMPIEACDIRSQPHPDGTPAPVPSGQETIGNQSTGSSAYYGFILQSEPGTVAIAQWDTKATSLFAGGDVLVLDADPLTPGKNGITVGEDPVAIGTDKVGCFELTANAGSCDMSALDINSALNFALDNVTALANKQPVRVDRMTVTSSTGKPLRSKPAAMAVEPPTGTIGVSCPAQPTGLAYVAYPSCHLVAGIDVATGTVVTGIQYDAMGVATIVTGDVSCPDECGGGGAIGPGPRPVTLDLEHDPRSDRRALAIGSENSNAVTIVELDLNDRPLSVSNVLLKQNPTNDLGVTDVAISPNIGMGGSSGFINDDSALGGEMQFVYAVATDNTVRVANIFQVLNQECDTQIDPRYLHDVKNVKTLSCLPVDDPTLPRRPGARGPGIALTGDAIPTSIDIFKTDAIDGDTRLPGTPTRLIGYFGVITAANGATYILNVDNDDYADFVDSKNPIGTAIPLDIAHQLRDALPNRGQLAEENVDNTEIAICDTKGPDPKSSSGNSAGPRSVDSPNRTVPTGTLAAEKVGALPSIRQVLCMGHDENRPVSELEFAAPIDVRDAVYPDIRGMAPDETWTMTWEGSMSIDSVNTAVDGPAVRESQLFVDALGMKLVDQTHPYCDAGVEPYDIVQLRGCDPTIGDADCPIGYTCFVHPQSQVTNLGACMLSDEADRLANACKEFLTSQRRYTIGQATSGELVLLPRKHVLRTTPVDGCTSDQQCQALATYALQNASSANPVDDTTPADTHTFSCAVDDQRKPELDAGGMPMKRCIETCTQDSDCDTGTVCSNGTCMEGVIPPQACVNAPQKYELRVGEAFAVIGTRTGFTHPIIEEFGTGKCIQNPNANRLQTGRLPLRAPACDPTADPRTGKKPDGTYDANPCETTVDETEYQPNFIAGTCTAGTPATTIVTRPADAIRFKNQALTLTMVDPTYPGDARCIGDRMGNLGKVPIMPPLFQTSVEITAGFTPLLITNINPAYPIKVTRGPQESIWVIDAGDFLSTSLATPSTRGKVFRVESQTINVVNTLQ